MTDRDRPDVSRFNWYDALLIGVLVFLLFLVLSHTAGATTITGTIRQNGQPFTGYVDIGLVYPATNGQAVALPGTQRLAVYNGQFPAITLEGNDTLLPRGTYYQVGYRDATGALIARSNYVITGATYDIGAAVPTPVTPANINYLDLLGIRNLSAQNFTLTNQLQIGGGAIYSKNGVSGAKYIDSIQFAEGYASSSSTCGVAEALAALPATGGTVILQSGSCTLQSGITINKPASIVGVGGGGATNGSYTAYSSPSLLISNVAGSAITVTPASGSLTGVALKGFAINGNSLSSAATVTLSGAVVNPVLDGLVVYGGGGDGVLVTGAVSHLYVTNSYSTSNAGNGWNLTSTPAAGPYAFTSSGGQYNTQSGLVVSGPGVGAVGLTDSDFSHNVVNGGSVALGTTAASLTATRSSFSDNASGLVIADGFGHSITNSQFQVGTHQSQGLVLNLPAGPASTVQAIVTGNYLAGNLTYDFVTSAAATSIIYFPQLVDRTSASYHESLGNPSAIKYVLFATTAITQAASAAGCTTGTSSYNVCATTVTWPTAFADTAYFPQCVGINPNTDGSGGTGRTKLVGITAVTTTSVTVSTGNDGTASGVGYGTISCTAYHP